MEMEEVTVTPKNNVKFSRRLILGVTFASCAVVVILVSVAIGLPVWILVLTKRGEVTCDYSTKQDVTLPSFYSDHMVLQRAPSMASIWGYSKCGGQAVSLNLRNKTYDVTSYLGPENKSIWRVVIEPIEEPGPYTITIKSGVTAIELRDVMFGDVWLCSGQSNMEFEIWKLQNSSDVIEDAHNYSDVRMLKIEPHGSPTPLYNTNEEYIPRKWSKPDANQFREFSALCWLFGKRLYKKTGHPIGLIAASIGATVVEAWSSPDALKQCHITSTVNDEYPHMDYFPENQYSWSWNAMIHPLLNITIKGAIWYQGESNVPKFTRYNCSFPALIGAWRKGFHTGSAGLTDPLLPFGFVQLSAYYHRVYGFRADLLPDMRWSQTAYYGYVPNTRLKNVFMAVAVDLPDLTSPYHNIHPRWKEDIAHRLMLGALAIAYDYTNITYQGPLPSEIIADSPGTHITLVYRASKIEVLESTGFEVFCRVTQSWLHADILSSHDHTVTIYTAGCYGVDVTMLRYLWDSIPCDIRRCAIYGKETGLPAPPFIKTVSGEFTIEE